MSSNRNIDRSVPVTQPVLLGRRPIQYTVEDVVKLVRMSFLAAAAKIDMVEDKNASENIEVVPPIDIPPTAILY
jgi:hypothetical protein